MIRFIVVSLSIIGALITGVLLPSVALAQTDPGLGWFSMINAQNVLSFLVSVGFVGAGWWFNSKGWPWISGYMERNQTQGFEFREKQQTQDLEFRCRQQQYEYEFRQEQNALQRDTLQIIGSVSLALGEVVALMTDVKYLISKINRAATNDKTDS